MLFGTARAHFWIVRLAALVFFIASSSACASVRSSSNGATRIAYRARIEAPTQQYLAVEMSVTRPTGRTSDVSIPAWTPGSYKIRDYARNIYDVRARTPNGRELPLERLDKQTWRVVHGGRPFEVSYRVFADERSVRDSFIDDRGALLNGASVWMYLHDAQAVPARLALEFPREWQAYTALPVLEQSPGKATFAAADYDTLVDGPVLLGTPAVRTFTTGGATFEYVFDRGEDVNADVDRFARDTEAIVKALGHMMGGFPFERYVFLVLVTTHGGGGLEHADSTVMMLRRNTFETEAVYERAARLAAHEFFHLWNVKRIRDAALSTFDYGAENYTRLLWFHEGFTRYVEDLAMVRAGLLDPRAYLDRLEGKWTTYEQHTGRDYDPIADISFEAWIKQYQPAPNHPNVSVSYYEKGGWIGLLLDLELRMRAAARGRESSVVHLFRRLMQTHGALGRGLTEEELVDAVSAEAGEDMRWFFERYIHGREPLPIPERLEQMGVAVSSKPLWNDPRNPKAHLSRAYAGITLVENRVGNIVPGSPAAKAGLMRGDEIATVGPHETRTRDDVLTRLAEAGPGATVELQLIREGRVLGRSLVLEETPYVLWDFTWQPYACIPKALAALRVQWMQGRQPTEVTQRCIRATMDPQPSP